ncbi:autoinducer binding domain-containing protein [Telluria sp. B2]
MTKSKIYLIINYLPDTLPLHVLIVLRHFETLLLAPTRAHLLDSVRQLAYSFGFESFVYGDSAPGRSRQPQQSFDATDLVSGQLLTAYPESWTRRYIEAGYVDVDPLIALCSRSPLPQLWHRLALPGDSRTGAFFDEARQHGIAAGMTCSLIGSNGALSLLSLTLERNRERDRRVVERHVSQGHMLISYLHESVRRLDAQGTAAPAPVRLTAREKEVLTWVSAGKTSWEIARILALAERTVVFHVDNAMKKLDTSTRTQAVAKAFSLGLIAP